MTIKPFTRHVRLTLDSNKIQPGLSHLSLSPVRGWRWVEGGLRAREAGLQRRRMGRLTSVISGKRIITVICHREVGRSAQRWETTPLRSGTPRQTGTGVNRGGRSRPGASVGLSVSQGPVADALSFAPLKMTLGRIHLSEAHGNPLPGLHLHPKPASEF